jgi:hypothetical protein
MSDKLASAKKFQVNAHRELSASLAEGTGVPTSACITLSVMRPDKVKVRAAGRGDVRSVYADGKTLTMLDAKKNFYATVPMKTSIDGLVERIDSTYGFTPPLAEFIVSNPGKQIRGLASKAANLGMVSYHTGFLGLEGVDCHRIALPGEVVDSELWIGVADQLPRKLLVSFKKHPGSPTLQIDFKKWNLAPELSERDFAFVPPAGAQKIPMRTKSEMEARIKKATGKN